MVSISTVVLVGMIYGGLIGLIICMAFAFLVKSYNLGLFGNAVTGICVGGGITVVAALWGAPLPILVPAMVLLPVMVMIIVGTILNARAR